MQLDLIFAKVNIVTLEDYLIFFIGSYFFFAGVYFCIWACKKGSWDAVKAGLIEWWLK